MKLVFVHGWGFDEELWEGLRGELGEFQSDTVDLGFFGQPHGVKPNGEAVIAVGHSLGLLWLLHERPFAWRGLVSISGMPRFTRSRDYRYGVSAMVLNLMIARFAREPEATLEEFFAYCGLKDRSVANIDAGQLAEGLRWLKTWDARDSLAAEQAPVLALYAEDDAIVPKELSADVFGKRPGTARTVERKGGHVLPLTRTDWCAQHIRAFARELA